MKSRKLDKLWTTAQSLEWLDRVVTPGVLGFYTHAEFTEVLAFSPGSKQPINVLSVAVLEAREGSLAQKPGFLQGETRIKLKSLPPWSFGVYRHVITIAKLFETLQAFDETGVWSPGGTPLQVDGLRPVAPQYVPPDASSATALNRLLKNNFWNGSYALEFFDNVKGNFQVFFDQPQRLQELAGEVQKHVPLAIASMADRLGNVIIQLPSEVLMHAFRSKGDTEGFQTEVAWHPSAKKRRLRAVASMEFDDVLCGYASETFDSSSVHLKTFDNSGKNRHLLWDEDNQLILAASGPLYFLRSIGISSGVGDLEPRTFSEIQDDGSRVDRSVMLTVQQSEQTIGAEDPYGYRRWTRRRIYDEEANKLVRERRFIQYGTEQGDEEASHQSALEDIRFLINEHGAGGVWLWDPFLSSLDILRTLFHCAHSGVEIRALTDGEQPRGRAIDSNVLRSKIAARRLTLRGSVQQNPYQRRKMQRSKVSTALRDFVGTQRKILEEAAGNCRGLRLEYRIRTGNAGMRFHDRFLIFPNTHGQVRAWSLGTSLNSVGKAHHILQRADNGRLIADAFQKLWDRLNSTENLIWKTP